MQKLAVCEQFLLRSMPVLPLFFDSYNYLCKPYVSGFEMNVLGGHDFRAARIDTNWRSS
jgi:hypothetical protein